MTQPSVGFILPLSDEYLTAIGGVLAQWSVFELEFDRVLWILRLAPAAKALMPDVPKSLRNRLDLFRDSARACFSSCPTLAEKLVAISGEARATSKQRNLLAHGRWGVGKYHVTVHLIRDGQLKHQKLTIECLQKLQRRISENHGMLIELTHISPLYPLSHLLTSDEKYALKEHYKNNWPPPPAPVPHRGPE